MPAARSSEISQLAGASFDACVLEWMRSTYETAFDFDTERPFIITAYNIQHTHRPCFRAPEHVRVELFFRTYQPPWVSHRIDAVDWLLTEVQLARISRAGTTLTARADPMDVDDAGGAIGRWHPPWHENDDPNLGALGEAARRMHSTCDADCVFRSFGFCGMALRRG
jgi:hypothetical protein